eukprot:CAMPEP_0170402874 /NCGR_PEP_ID=MMETSP0117_2-20130122/25793_1 /TAXON_ID=400756 /ORGANISM="Durinskia baltica, Strain CSIRO CS-38" /LENGTH=192 /DNA_ID=CAMNT_0010659777 /DNA_START=568 /DNA_END=1143 /DNA_ORIENTATION=-
MTHHQHGVCVVVILLGVICNFALNVENNDSRLFHLPKDEFVKVLSEIISGGEDQNANTSSVVEGTSEEGEFYDPMDPAGILSQQSTQRSSKSSYRTVDDTPRAAATRQAQAKSNGVNGLSMGENNPGSARGRSSGGGAGQAKRVKSDSLYFLQRSMEQREKAYREGLDLTARTDDSEYVDPGATGRTEDGFM